MAQEHEEIYRQFGEAVNMTATELKKWLSRNESKQVGQKESDGAESVGHEYGGRIVEILGTKKSDLTDADYDHMNKVVGYVHRHLAQRPEKDITDSAWRYSLLNWGHDPEKSG